MSKPQRKILACPDVRSDRGRVTASIDPDLARSLLLYWDQMVFLSHNHAELSLSHDEEFLKSTKILDVARVRLDWTPPDNFAPVEAEFAYNAVH